MSDAVKLETPLGNLLRKPKLKRLTSIVSSYQQPVKKVEHAKKEEKIALEPNQKIVNRFLMVKRLGSGGFGEVERERKRERERISSSL